MVARVCPHESVATCEPNLTIRLQTLEDNGGGYSVLDRDLRQRRIRIRGCGSLIRVPVGRDASRAFASLIASGEAHVQRRIVSGGASTWGPRKARFSHPTGLVTATGRCSF
jgi:hypothetical protein